MGTKNIIGERIRTLRLSHNMTQADLAKALNQSQSSITMYETGRREPDFETLEALADVFNVPLIYFVNDGKTVTVFTDDKPPDSDAPITHEVRIISGGIDKMPPERRAQALKILQVAFAEYSDLFKEDHTDDA